ncbi:hypothetical protein [uncultured Hyphomonas sp.]|uniref:hypothetical protein n=1 Tax=uncultured Hyphomonas sp. TaxID=225298 RepID=UPI002AAA88E4|nr:hypothetical protein [uncultured Hyphomonas sp.]
MNPLPFSFGNAVTHFTKTGGPAGFLWKFALAYAAMACLVQAVSVMLQWPVYEAYIQLFTGDGGFERYAEDMEDVSVASSLSGLLVMPLGILLWVMFEAANQRRYMRGDGFGLRIGADEGRLLIVGLIWIALFIGMYLGFAVTVAIPVAAGFLFAPDGVVLAILLGVVMMIGYMMFVLWLSARLSAAAALTVRDRQIRFFESWRVTRGKGWTIVGSWIVLGLIAMFVLILFYLLLAALGIGLLSAQLPGVMDGGASEDEIIGAIISPMFWLPMLAVVLAFTIAQSTLMHIFSGPAALAARTDPDWISAGMVGEFD